MFTIKISLPTGPTIMDEDQVPVAITRVEYTPERVRDIQEAALTLGATSVSIERGER